MGSVDTSGPVTQSVEDLTFNQDDGGSSPSGPTKDILIAKQCQHCKNPMYIRRTGEQEPYFAGCEPCVVDIKIERKDKDTIIVTGQRSTSTIRCASCKRKHKLVSFDEVKDGIPSA